MNNVKIYVAMHQPDDRVAQIPLPYYIPIHCGKAIYVPKKDKTGFLPTLGDDTGDNISDQNPHYCELTAVYWIWKNDDSAPDDIVGINHYRRYFNNIHNFHIDKLEPEKAFEYLLTKEHAIDILSKYDYLVRDSGDIIHNSYSPEQSVYIGYKTGHIIQDLDNALLGIKELFPNLYDTMEHEIKFNGAMCTCNLMLAKKKNFDKYCEFLFPVLSYVNDRIDYSDDYHSEYQARVLGFLSERLMRPWFIATHQKVTDTGQINLKD